MASLTFNGTIKKTQLWSRKAMGDLWAQRETLLSRDEADILDNLYKARSVAGPHQSQRIEYHTSSKSAAGRAGYGRLYGYGGFSLEKVNADLRATLCRDVYHDLDIVNAQPAILRTLADKHGRPLPQLAYYVDNREAVLEGIASTCGVSRAEAKKSVIAVLYGGTSTLPELRPLATEVREFSRWLSTTDDWAPLWELAPKEERPGSFLSLVLQNEERRCLLAMSAWMEARGWSVDVLAYDGFMVRRREGEAVTADLLEGLQAAVLEKTGYCVTIAEKEMTGLIGAASAAPPAPGFIIPEDQAITDRLAAVKMVELLGDNIKKQGSILYIYNETTGMWDSDKRADFRAAVHLGERLTLSNSKGSHHYGSMAKKTDAMLRYLPDLVPSSDWIRDHCYASKGKLLFDNGIYDMVAGTWTEGFDPSLVFTARAGRALGPRDEAVITEVKNTVFGNPYKNPAVGLFYAHSLARAIAGHTEDKVFLVNLGEPNTGKSTATTLMANAFGGFVSIWNLDNLKFKPGSTTDEAKKLSWLADCINSRLAVSNEARMDGVKLDGNLAKRISGGGDDVTFRQNFRDEQTVRLQTTFMAMANDMPEFSPIDEALRVRGRYIQSDHTFVPKPAEECVLNEKPADPDLKAKIASAAWMDAFAWTIFDAYGGGLRMAVPDEVTKATDDYLPPPAAGLADKLEEAGLAIGEPTDWVPAREIINALKAAGVALSDTKIGRELTKLGLSKEDRKVDGRTIRVWKGVKQL